MYGLIGAAIGAISRNFNTSESIAANKQEQQSNRDYNLNLAKMQNQWNREQWEREAQYNSPAAYRARLAAAGMNPDLAYGNVNGTAPASPGMTSGEPSSPVDYSAIAGKQTIGSAVSQALANEQAQANIALTQAQKNKTDEEAGKASEEAKGVHIDNLTRSESNTLEIQLKQGVIKLNDSNQKPELAQSFLVIDPEQVTDVFSVTKADDGTELTDKIYGQIWFDCTAKLPISRVAIPRLD